MRGFCSGSICLCFAGVGDAPAVASVKLVSVVEPSSSASLPSTGPTFFNAFVLSFLRKRDVLVSVEGRLVGVVGGSSVDDLTGDAVDDSSVAAVSSPLLSKPNVLLLKLLTRENVSPIELRLDSFPFRVPLLVRPFLKPSKSFLPLPFRMVPNFEGGASLSTSCVSSSVVVSTG